MMYTIGRVKAGDKVLILGASGGVGSCCVQLAKLAGCEVIACSSSAAKLERLKALGADHVLDTTQHKLTDWVFERFGKPHRRQFTNGVDVVVNFTGGDTWVPSLRILHRQGKLLTCGATAGFDPKEDIRYIWSFELQVLGSNGWMREDVEKLFELVRERQAETHHRPHLRAGRRERSFQRTRKPQRIRKGGGAPMSENKPRLDAAEMARRFAASPFIKTLNLEVLALDYDKTELTLRMPQHPSHERRPGTKQFHGGAIASLIDIAGDFAIGMMVGGGVPTINLRIDYLKPAVGDSLTAIGRVRRTRQDRRRGRHRRVG